MSRLSASLHRPNGTSLLVTRNSNSGHTTVQLNLMDTLDMAKGVWLPCGVDPGPQYSACQKRLSGHAVAILKFRVPSENAESSESFLPRAV
jgi:hypothetical protein